MSDLGELTRSFQARQVIALLDVERNRSLKAEEEIIWLKGRLDEEHTLIAAFRSLGKTKGFTEQEAREAWKNSGYGGL